MLSLQLIIGLKDVISNGYSVISNMPKSCLLSQMSYHNICNKYIVEYVLKVSAVQLAWYVPWLVHTSG